MRLELLALSFVACVDAAPPAGFAPFRDWLGFRAVSADGVTYRVRTEDNEPPASLAFWKEALKKRMVDAGYAFVSESDTKLGDREAYYLELAAPVGPEDYSYAVAIALDGGDLVIAEAAGEVTRFAAHKDAILAAFKEVD
jgi:hypothetical protein